MSFFFDHVFIHYCFPAVTVGNISSSTKTRLEYLNDEFIRLMQLGNDDVDELLAYVKCLFFDWIRMQEVFISNVYSPKSLSDAVSQECLETIVATYAPAEVYTIFGELVFLVDQKFIFQSICLDG